MFCFPMTICVAWRLRSGDAGRFGSPGWAGAALGGRKCPQAGGFWARSCASLGRRAGGKASCPSRDPRGPFPAVPSMPYPDERRKETRFPPFSFRCPRAGVEWDRGCVPVSLSTLGCFWRRRSPLCCRKPRFGVLGGGTGSPEQPCPPQGSRRRALCVAALPSPTKCLSPELHSFCISCRGLVHSSLPPPEEQLVVAAYKCLQGEGGRGERGHLNSFCS